MGFATFRQSLSGLPVVFALLVGFAVAGRLAQPEWNVTPLAAVGLLAGYALPWRFALVAPPLALYVSNLVLPTYLSSSMAVAVYGSMLVAPLLGRLLTLRVESRVTGAARLGVCAVVPSLVFFLTTNLAVWATTSMYPRTIAGIAECYTAAVPFYRSMVAGDLAYTAILFSAAAAAGAFSLRGLPRDATDDGLPARL